MGRHRSDPMGIARLALAGLAVLALLFLIALGGRSLIGALGSEPASSASASAPAPATGAPSATPARVPTVLVECAEEHCPTVFLKVAGGDVLLNREMARGEQAQAFDDKVDVVLTDASTVRVRVNGVVRPPGGAGERQEFTAVRE